MDKAIEQLRFICEDYNLNPLIDFRRVHTMALARGNRELLSYFTRGTLTDYNCLVFAAASAELPVDA